MQRPFRDVSMMSYKRVGRGRLWTRQRFPSRRFRGRSLSACSACAQPAPICAPNLLPGSRFLTMVYIVFVNPQILGNTGMDKGAVFVATCIAAAASTLVMALYANYPIALAPGMGLNAFFAFTVVLTMKYSWQQALAAVFCSGVIFFLISVFRVREYIVNAIPRNLKLAISAGVGLFLGIIALEEAKIVVANPATLVTLGDLKQWPAILCLAGFIVIVALNYRNILGATLIGILVVALV